MSGRAQTFTPDVSEAETDLRDVDEAFPGPRRLHHEVALPSCQPAFFYPCMSGPFSLLRIEIESCDARRFFCGALRFDSIR